MKTIFKHKFLAGAALFAALFAAASCEDNDTGLKVTEDVPYADKTLYEVLNEQDDLTSFMEVINACGPEFADSLFNQSRVYTVFAPVNEAMDAMKEELVAKLQNEDEREQVLKTFVRAHVANHLRPANGVLEEGNRIMMLNDKKTEFTGSYSDGYEFDNVRIVEPNIRAWNGIVHKLEAPVEYKHSIWEFLAVDSEEMDGYKVDSLANYLYSFNVREFDEYQSVLGPVVNGEQTYLDSVFVVSNKWLNPYSGVGYIDLEDSIYTMYVPTNDVWNEYMALADSYFKYDCDAFMPATLDTTILDSLRNYYPRINFIKYLSYSEGERKYIEAKHPDSISPAYLSDYPRKVFPKSQLENEHVVLEKQMSNGFFKIVDKFPYSPLDLWLDTIKLEAENNEMRFECSAPNNSNILAGKLQINREDSLLLNSEVSGSYYFEAIPSKVTDGVIVDFRIPNVMSTKYKVALIVLPKHIANPRVTAEELMPTYFNVKITQAGSGTLYEYTDNKFTNRENVVDTLFLIDDKGEPAIIDIPACEYYKLSSYKDYSTTITVSSINPGRSVPRKDTSIRLDAILLIPVLEEE